jgi:hypothetical protein
VTETGAMFHGWVVDRGQTSRGQTNMPYYGRSNGPTTGTAIAMGTTAFPPSTIEIHASICSDGLTCKPTCDMLVLTTVANSSRPDLVPAVCPTPYHGFEASLPAAAAAALRRNGNNCTVSIFAQRTGSSKGSKWQLTRSPMCVTDWRRACSWPSDCSCAAPEPAPFSVSNSLRCVVHGNTPNDRATTDTSTHCTTTHRSTHQATTTHRSTHQVDVGAL